MGKRYDELHEALLRNDLAVLRDRVLPDALIAKGQPSLPLIALRAGQLEAVQILLDVHAPGALAAPLEKLVHFASTSLKQSTADDEAIELLRLGVAAGLESASAGQSELAAVLAQPALFDALAKLLPKRTDAQNHELAWTALVGAGAVPEATFTARVKALNDLDATAPGKESLLFVAIARGAARHVKILLKRGFDPKRPGGERAEPSILTLDYAPGMDAIAYAEARIAATAAAHPSFRKQPLAVLNALGASAATAAPISPARAAVQTALRGLGKKLKLNAKELDEALQLASPGTARDAAAPTDPEVGYAVAALGLLGRTLLDRDVDFESDDFLDGILRGAPFDGRPTDPRGCEDPAATAALLARGQVVATAHGASLVACAQPDGVTMLELDARGHVTRHESVAAWLTARTPLTRRV